MRKTIELLSKITKDIKSGVLFEWLEKKQQEIKLKKISCSNFNFFFFVNHGESQKKMQPEIIFAEVKNFNKKPVIKEFLGRY